MSDSNYISSSLALLKRNLAFIMIISFITSLIYTGYAVYDYKAYTKFEINALLPDTSQGEIAQFYAKSPFKSLRISFFQAEYFNKADFFIKTEKSITEGALLEEFTQYLDSYYQSRDIGVAHMEAQLTEKNNLEFKLKTETESIMKNLNYLEIMKKKYPLFSSASYIKIEEKIVNHETRAMDAKRQLELINERSVIKPKVTKITQIPNQFPIPNFIIKLTLVFFASGLAVFLMLYTFPWILRKQEYRAQ